MESALHKRRCVACEGDVPQLSDHDVEALLQQLDSDWQIESDTPRRLRRELSFRNYYETTAFVNALAWIAHQQNHHPDISFSYRHCVVTWTTHAADGLTLNDFICAAQTDELLMTRLRDSKQTS